MDNPWAAGLAIILYIPKEFPIKLNGVSLTPFNQRSGDSYFWGKRKKSDGGNCFPKKVCPCPIIFTTCAKLTFVLLYE